MLLALTLSVFLQDPIAPPDVLRELDLAFERLVEGAHAPGTREELEAWRAFEAAVYDVTQIPQWAEPEVRQARARLEALADRHGPLLGSYLRTVFVAQLELGVPESSLLERLATRHAEPGLAWAVVEALARRPNAERLFEFERILALHRDEFAGERQRDDMVHFRSSVVIAGRVLRDAQQYEGLVTTVERLDFLAPRVGASWGIEDWFLSSEVKKGPVDVWREGHDPLVGWSRSLLRQLHEVNPHELLRLLLEHDFEAFQAKYLESWPGADKFHALAELRENLARLLGDDFLRLFRARTSEKVPTAEAR